MTFDKIPGQQLIRNVDAGADALEFGHQVVAVPAGRRWRVELDVLARLQVLDHAGIHPLQRVPGFRIGGLRADGQAARTLGPRYDPREARLGLLPHALRVPVVVEVAERQHHRRQPWHAADLAGPQDAVGVHHLGGRHRLAQNAAARIQHVDAARVIVIKPVRLALSEEIELNALNDAAPSRYPSSGRCPGSPPPAPAAGGARGNCPAATAAGTERCRHRSRRSSAR